MQEISTDYSACIVVSLLDTARPQSLRVDLWGVSPGFALLALSEPTDAFRRKSQAYLKG